MSRQNNRSRRGTQGRKDSSDKRINLDNERVTKYEKGKHDEEKSVTTSKCNDASWYAWNAELMKSSASLPFSTYTGQAEPFRPSQDAIPGVMALNWEPMIGGYGNGWDAANQAAKSMYSFVVHANSRNQSYDANDLMIMVLGGAQVFSFLAHAIRAYGVMKTYDQRNSYLPRGLVRAMGFDFDDLASNLSKMWFDINQLIAMSHQIWIPNTMPIITRWFWMNTNIFMDSTTPKAQFYLYNPNTVFKYDETALQTGGSLQRTTWDGNSANTWSTYMTVITEMINNLLNSQDRGIMMGDILKAYGEDKIYRLSPIMSDYTVIPVYDAEVLSQIENSVVINYTAGAIGQTKAHPLDPTDPEMMLSQGSSPLAGTIGDNPTYYRQMLPSKTVLNFHFSEVPTPEQNMVATRLKPIGLRLAGTTGNYMLDVKYCGTEILSNCRIWYYHYQNDVPTLVSADFTSFEIAADNLETSTDFYNHMQKYSKLETFDWHPFIYMALGPWPQTVGLLDNIIPYYAYGDYDNYTYLDPETVQKMHTTAVYSEFGVPVM